MSGNKSRHHMRNTCFSIRRLSVLAFPFFADLVVLAGEFHPIPFRTRPLKPPAPMVLRLKPRESRSLPGQQRTETASNPAEHNLTPTPRAHSSAGRFRLCRSLILSGCSSAVGTRRSPRANRSAVPSDRYKSRRAYRPAARTGAASPRKARLTDASGLY